MARIRSIHPGLFTDEAFLELTTDEPLAIAMLLGVWCESDDHGIFEWKPLRFKMRIIGATNADAGKLLDVLAGVGFVRRFEDGGRSYGACRNFCKWQRPKTPQYVHPFPPGIVQFVSFVEGEADKTERGTALGRLLSDRQDGKCHYCGTEVTFYRKKVNSLEIDHRTPIVRGGEDTIDNLVASCRDCNSLKSSMTEDEFRAKFAEVDLPEIHASRRAKGNSQSAKPLSRPPKLVSLSPEREIPPQREEGGGREGRTQTQKPRVVDAQSARGTRLPPDWDPGSAGTAFARESGLDPSSVLAKFKDYWLAQPGVKGRKSDWVATWRNWCRNEQRRPAAVLPFETKPKPSEANPTGRVTTPMTGGF